LLTGLFTRIISRTACLRLIRALSSGLRRTGVLSSCLRLSRTLSVLAGLRLRCAGALCSDTGAVLLHLTGTGLRLVRTLPV
jgi:hypothetical protein